jgi:hypothetical protein
MRSVRPSRAVDRFGRLRNIVRYTCATECVRFHVNARASEENDGNACERNRVAKHWRDRGKIQAIQVLPRS